MADLRDHLAKYPSPRTSTLRYLEKRNETTSRLMEENRRVAEANRKVNEFRDRIWYVSWPRACFDAFMKKIGRV